MHAEIDLVQIAFVVIASLFCGLSFERFKQPAVLGYIVSGILLGPSVLGLVNNREVIGALAELGVLMLLFLVGMELSLRAFKKVWLLSLGVTLLQLGAGVLSVLGLGKLFGMSFEVSLVLGFAIALSSTAVAIKMLESIGELRTNVGKVAVGVLIAQDLAIVPVILILRNLSGDVVINTILIKIAISVGILGLLIWYLSRRERISLPFTKTFSGNKDLTTLLALFFCFGMAALSGLIDLSAAYGAFLGGLILGNTTERHQMIEATHPIQSVLMMVFFVSVGMLIDFGYIWDNLGKVLTLLLLITFGKTFFNISVLHFFKQPWPQAFLAGLILSQMGEFAFLLVTIGIDEKILDPDGNGSRLIMSLAALSLTLSPFWMAAARRIHDLAPKGIKSLPQLMNTAYAQEMKAISTLSEGCKKSGEWIVEKTKETIASHQSEESKNKTDDDTNLEAISEQESDLNPEDDQGLNEQCPDQEETTDEKQEP